MKKKVFTLLELLVVIAVIAILASILLPTLEQAKEKARRAVCMSGLKQWGYALHSYAQEYADEFPGGGAIYPVCTPGWRYPWMLYRQGATDPGAIPIREEIERHGLVRDSFYCPSHSAWNRDTFWNYSTAPFVGTTWMGYTLFCNAPTGGGGSSPGLSNILPRNLRRSNPDWVLAADKVRFWQNPPVEGTPLADVNHARAGHASAPTGGNILFVDAHVRWKPWPEYKLGTYFRGSASDTYYYAW